MLNIGDIVTIKIIDIGVNFEGIGKIDNKIVFVKYCTINDIVKCKILKIKNNFIEASLICIVNNNNNNKNNNLCKYFYICGGCQAQHILYEKQLEYKKNIFIKNFEKISKIQYNNAINIVKCNNEFNYRNKAIFTIQYKNNKYYFGFYELHTHNIIDIDECKLCTTNINIAFKIIKKYLIDNCLIIQYNISKIIIKEYSVCIQIIIISNNKQFIVNKDLYDTLQQSINKSITIYCGYIINNKKTYFDIENIHININYGTDEYIENIDNIKYIVNKKSFFQINYDIFIKLYKYIKSIINKIQEKCIIINAYSGSGLLSLFLITNNYQIINIDIQKEAIEIANKNNIINNINKSKITNICCDFTFFINNFNVTNKKTIFILDPPRCGCSKMAILNIIKHRPYKIIYISCDHCTLARDINLLTQNNLYFIESIQLFDMFPQTKHIETVCILSIND